MKLERNQEGTRRTLIIAIMAVVGLILLVRVLAAGSPVSVDPDDADLRVSDTTAYNGSAIEFKGNGNGQVDGATYIAPSAPTNIPVYDTGWQMLVRNTPAQMDEYFATLKEYGFTGSWMGVVHHLPAAISFNGNSAYAGTPGSFDANRVWLNEPYINHVNQILDIADSHGMKVGLVVAWQDVYLPYEPGWWIPEGNQPWTGIVDERRACGYGEHLVEEFGDHPALSMWVYGGDGGENATLRVRDVFIDMDRCMREAGSTLATTYHTGTKTWRGANGGNPIINYPPNNPSRFDGHLYLADGNESDWLDFVGIETGHAQGAATTGSELRASVEAYDIPVWAGEPRYFNITCCGGGNYQANDMRDDALAAKNAGVSGYVYGDAGRWTACFAGTNLDATPCNPNDYAGSFGAGERAVIEVFSD